jgi:hypothetical protein
MAQGIDNSTAAQFSLAAYRATTASDCVRGTPLSLNPRACGGASVLRGPPDDVSNCENTTISVGSRAKVGGIAEFSAKKFSKENIWRSSQQGDDAMYEIKPVSRLNIYDDGVNAGTYEYRDAQQKFFFWAQLTNSAPSIIDGGKTIKQGTFDILVTMIGCVDGYGGTRLRPVENIITVKDNITTYFKSHRIPPAKTFPSRVTFE